MSWELAVDFGTSNTTAAILRDGQVSVLRLESGGSMPSAVALVGGEFRIGTHALNARRAVPDAFEGTPKLLVGGGTTVLDGDVYPAQRIVSAVLARVRAVASERAGHEEPSRIVLTHPIAWTPQQLDELAAAAVEAGFSRERMVMIPEPIAAAYGLADSGLRLGDRVAIVDWGGGTCDVAVLERSPGQPDAPFIVTCWAGDGALGGNDLDNRLFRLVLSRLLEAGEQAIVERLGTAQGLGARLTLMEDVRRAKEELSWHETAQVLVATGDDEATLTITRQDYEQVIADEIARVLGTLEEGLGSPGSTGLSQVILTGGSSLTPALARAIEKRIGVPPVHSGDPKLIVAEGALRVPREFIAAEPAAAEARPQDPPAETSAPAPEAADSAVPVVHPSLPQQPLPPVPSAAQPPVSQPPAPQPPAPQPPEPRAPEPMATGPQPLIPQPPLAQPPAPQQQSFVAPAWQPAQPVPQATAPVPQYLPVAPPMPQPGPPGAKRGKGGATALIVIGSVVGGILVIVLLVVLLGVLGSLGQSGGGSTGGGGDTDGGGTGGGDTTESVLCWNGTSASRASACPSFNGLPALEWAFEDIQAEPVTCETNMNGDAEERLCGFDAYPEATIFVFDTSTPEGQDDLARLSGLTIDGTESVTLDNGDTVGTVTYTSTSTDGVQRELITVFEYTDLPIAIWIQVASDTALTADQMADQVAAWEATYLRYQEDIDRAAPLVP